MSAQKGARLVFDLLPPAKNLIADRSEDSAASRRALVAKGIPSSRSRKILNAQDKPVYRQRAEVENLFAKLRDWKGIVTRCDLCGHTVFRAIGIAAAVIFWL